jgi:hypothetical protein
MTKLVANVAKHAAMPCPCLMGVLDLVMYIQFPF